MCKPHKHAAIIKAWADGSQVQGRRDKDYEWVDLASPIWSVHKEYRVKPEPKPNSIILMQMTRSVAEGHQCAAYETETPNIKCTFDGDTGKLKAVEMI